MTIRELMEKRSKLVADMRAIAEKPEGEGGDLSKEQETRFTSLKAELEATEKALSRQSLLDEAERRMQGEPITGTEDDKLDTELRKFSLIRAIAGQCPDLNVDWGRERELSQELQRRSGRTAQGGMVPMQVFEQRVNTTTTAANIIPTDYRGEMFIDLLRAKLVIGSLGATVLNGLSGNVDIPGQSGSTTAGWVAENSALTASDMSFRKVTMAPKHAGAMTELSRNMLLQTSPDLEALVRSDFAAILAEAIDKAAIVGGGVNEPTGILSTSGIGDVAIGPNGGALTWEKVLDLVGVVEDAEVPTEGCAFLTHPHVVKQCRKTLKVSGDAVAGFLMDSRDTLDGFRVARTSLVPNDLTKGTAASKCAPLIFGNFSDLLIGYWSAFDLLVNPYETTAYSKGNVLVRAMLTCDMAVRRPQSFAAIKDVVA